jgi:hypothetical protein
VTVKGVWDKKGAWEGDKWVVGQRWVETRSATAQTNYTISVFDRVDGKLLTRDTSYKSGTFDHIVIKNGVNIGTSYTGKVEILKDGRLKLYVVPTVEGAQAGGDYKIYQRVGNEWKLVFYKHQVQDPVRASHMAWMEESWSADGGRYVQDIWAVEDHSIAKENDGWHYSRTVVEGGKATTTFYHTAVLYGKPVPYMWGSVQQWAKDAQVTYVHAVDANGKLGEMLSFQIIPDGRGDWENTWTKDSGWDTNSGGWPYGGHWNRPVEPGVQHGDFKFGYPVQLNLGGGAETVDVGTLPFLKVESRQAQDGTFVETISDVGHTQAVQFVYSGPDRQTLIQQTVGHMESGQWVQTTTRSKDLTTRIEDRLKAGGNDVRETWRANTSDGFTITYRVTTPEIHWDIDTNKNFIQNWDGTVTLQFKKVGTIDGVDQYELVKVTSDVTWWHQRSNSDWKTTDNQPLSKLGVTEADLQALVASWNARAAL